MPAGRNGMKKFLSSKVSSPLIRKTAGRLAENIDKESFIEQLKMSWAPYIKKGADLETEVTKARERVNKAGPFSIAFTKLGLTDDDLRVILKDIIDNKPEPLVVEKKIGRNEPCPCGSGRKYKKCCGK
jgi:uncharacterized protein YecA (UPF0149 family)